ncbi:MAG: monovalent cation/H(+) antiporter subunit G [Salinarimonas sp.]|nr:monovalent cation/H(+) antiporter subunit G [Salinarimonas sp.]
MILAIVALLFKLVGVGFLCVATIGVLRFVDPFQRMHASTKAGTLGAGLVLVGVAIDMATLEAILVAGATFLFLLATLPVAGHMLGRASYISGAPLESSEDALEGVLPRSAQPLEARGEGAFERRVGAMLGGDDAEAAPEPRSDAAPATSGTPASGAVSALAAPGYDAVRFAIFGPDARALARRAEALAHARSVPLSGIAVIDEDCIARAKVPDPGEVIRSALAGTLAESQGVTAESRVPFSLTYEEGDPLALIPASDPAARELLLLPCEGWCDHGADLGLPAGEAAPGDKLFALAERHAGATLFVGTASEGNRIAVIHDGSERVQDLALWAFGSGLWEAREVVLTGTCDTGQAEALEAAAGKAGLTLARAEAVPEAVAAVIMAAPPAQQVHMAGEFWQDRIAKGFRGDVLVG